jgi:hypothetical protein
MSGGAFSCDQGFILGSLKRKEKKRKEKKRSITKVPPKCEIAIRCLCPEINGQTGVFHN